MWVSNQDICRAGRNVDLHVYVHFPVHFKHVSLWILKKEKKSNLYEGMSVCLYFLVACSFVTKCAWHSQLVPETCACCTWWLGLSVQVITTLASSCSEKLTSTDFLFQLSKYKWKDQTSSPRWTIVYELKTNNTHLCVSLFVHQMIDSCVYTTASCEALTICFSCCPDITVLVDWMKNNEKLLTHLLQL